MKLLTARSVLLQNSESQGSNACGQLSQRRLRSTLFGARGLPIGILKMSMQPLQAALLNGRHPWYESLGEQPRLAARVLVELDVPRTV